MPERPEPEITCRELVELVSDYLDAALDPATLDLVEEHLVLCDGCREHVARVRLTIGALAGLPAGAAPAPGMMVSLLGALREAAREEEA